MPNKNRTFLSKLVLQNHCQTYLISGTTCNFEDSTNSLCGWRNSVRDNLNWTRQNGKTPTFRTGPTKDVSVGTAQGT